MLAFPLILPLCLCNKAEKPLTLSYQHRAWYLLWGNRDGREAGVGRAVTSRGTPWPKLRGY